MLSVCSPYFQKIFIEHPSSHPILFMTDVNSNHMAGLLDFMYSGQVDKLISRQTHTAERKHNIFLENFSSQLFLLLHFRFKLLSFNFLLLIRSRSLAFLLLFLALLLLLLLAVVTTTQTSFLYLLLFLLSPIKSRSM